jgi:hypothetical protein
VLDLAQEPEWKMAAGVRKQIFGMPLFDVSGEPPSGQVQLQTDPVRQRVVKDCELGRNGASLLKQEAGWSKRVDAFEGQAPLKFSCKPRM